MLPPLSPGPGACPRRLVATCCGGSQGSAAPNAWRPGVPRAQIPFFKAATQYAFTMVFAGFAFTIMTLPKTSLFPALVAGLRRVLTMTRPGMVNLPAFLASLAPKAARASMTDVTCFFFSSHWSASAWATAPLLIALAAAFIALGAMPGGPEGG